MNSKKLFFPLYKKDRHSFLTEKWWFRGVIVIYVIAFIVTPIAIWLWYINWSAGWCYDNLELYSYDQTEFDSQLNYCSELGREAWLNGIPAATLGLLAIHYLIQVIFFKIIIDYVVLGEKK